MNNLWLFGRITWRRCTLCKTLDLMNANRKCAYIGAFLQHISFLWALGSYSTLAAFMVSKYEHGLKGSSGTPSRTDFKMKYDKASNDG